MGRGFFRQSSVLLVLALVLPFTGCAVFNIAKPTGGQTLPSPVAAEVDWGQSFQTFKVMLDPGKPSQQDVTGQFNVASVTGGFTATATLSMAPGPHTLVASGSLYTWYTGGYANTSTQRDFNVSGVPGTLTLTVTPTPLSVATSPGTLHIIVAIGGGASGPITINITGLPNQVTTNPTTLTSTGNGSLTTSISAPASVVGNTYPFTVSGTAINAPAASANASLEVVPTITSATPAAQRRGGTITLVGTHFDSICAHNKITIGSASATVSSPCSATSLTFTVPAGAKAGATSILATVNGIAASGGFAATVIPTEVAVVAGGNSPSFAVIDFTDPANASAITVNPGAGLALVVDCSGKTAAVGSASPGVGQVVMFDISDPAHPNKLGSFTSNFVQLGAIKFDGMRVLAGDATGPQVVLLDASSPNSLSQITKLSTGLAAVTSTALGGTRGVASGPNSSTIDILSGIPGNPSRASFNPNNGLGLSADLSGTSAAVGTKNGGTVKLVNVSTPAVSGSQSTTLGSIDSISISGSIVAVGSINNSSMFLVNFATPSSPQLSNAITLSGSAGGWTIVLDGSPLQSPLKMLAGDLSGFDVNLFSVTTNSAGTPSATLLKTVNSGIGSIASACLTSF